MAALVDPVGSGLHEVIRSELREFPLLVERVVFERPPNQRDRETEVALQLLKLAHRGTAFDPRSKRVSTTASSLYCSLKRIKQHFMTRSHGADIDEWLKAPIIDGFKR